MSQVDDPFAPTYAGQSSPGSAFTLPPGTSVGGFVIERLLGRGGMASVYLARRGQEPSVALKVMSPHLRDDPTFVARFLHEAKATSILHHPNVVRVLAAGEADGHHFMAVEFVDGGSIGDLLTSMGELPAPLAAEVITQTLAGLVHAHQRGIIHRDLKPENLLVTSTGVVKIADFGIARTTDGGKLTATGMLIGTAGYMSPEQAKGAPLDARSDLFTVGVILYELLSGQNPFASDNPATSLTRILTDDLVPVGAVKPTAPALLEQVLERLVAHDRDARFGTAQLALEALLPFVSERRRTQPRLLAESLQRPAELKQLLDTHTAELLVTEAKGLMSGDAAHITRAALKLSLALLTEPSHEEAQSLLAELAKRQLLYFGPTRNPKLAALERTLATGPVTPLQLQQAAVLARQEGNPLKATAYYKRYLKLRPDDVYAAQQLSQLTGERPRVPPRTADLVAGIKKGGFAATRQGPVSAPHPVVAPQPPQPQELLELAPTSSSNALWVVLLKVGLLVAAIAAVVAGVRRVSRAIDDEARNVMAEDRAFWNSAQQLHPPDGG